MLLLSHRLEALLFPFKCYFHIAPPHQKPFTVSRSMSQLPLEIWLEIFQFATYVHQSVSIKPLDPFVKKPTSHSAMGTNTPALVLRTKLALVLVNRAWRRVALHILYEHAVIKSPARAKMLLAILEASRQKSDSNDMRQVGYGQWMRHIEIYTHARGSNSIQYLQTIFRICQICSNIRILSGIWMHPLPIGFLDGISKLYSGSLEGLYWNDMDGNSSDTFATQKFITSFHSLRVLDLRHLRHQKNDGEAESDLDVSQDLTLPNVQDLIISTHSMSIISATIFSLPKLQRLTIETTRNSSIDYDLFSSFLKKHGAQITSVDLLWIPLEAEIEISASRRSSLHVKPDIFLEPGVCPNLRSLTFPVTSDALAPHVHHSLRRIGLHGVKADSLYPDKAGLAKAHLLAINPSKYPNLELIQTVSFLVEAESDGWLKDIFIWWVERFEKQGIDFLDGEGVLWTYTDPETTTQHESGGATPDSAVAVAKPVSKVTEATTKENELRETKKSNVSNNAVYTEWIDWL